MTKQHKATPEQWSYAETCAPEDFAGYACILELRDRLEALEATQQPLVNYAPVKPEYRDKLDRLIEQDRSNPQQLTLVDRLAVALLNAPRNSNADTKARTAILEVAAWLKEEGYSTLQAEALEQEANRG
jgi:hypothetical protein